MDDKLVDDVVSVNNITETSIICTLDHHSAHVCSYSYSGCKRSDGLVRLLFHFPKVHEVNGFVHNDHCKVFHFN